jgi:PPOX class probable F420-dependent enzyme
VLTPADQALLNSNAFGFLATVRADGSPHVSGVWVEYEDPYVVVTTERNFAKTRNVRRDPRVSLAVIDPANPYRQLVVFGTVASVDDVGAAERADALARRYLNLERFPQAADRPYAPVLVRIAAERVVRGPA